MASKLVEPEDPKGEKAGLARKLVRDLDQWSAVYIDGPQFLKAGAADRMLLLHRKLRYLVFCALEELEEAARQVSL